MPWKKFLRARDVVGGREPASRRLAQNLRDYDVSGEQAIALAQGVIAGSVLALHTFARFISGLPLLHSWVTVALALLIARSGLRWQLAKSKELPERALDALSVIDIGLFLALIWGYHYAYSLPAGAVLKAPSFVLLLVLIGLRAAFSSAPHRDRGSDIGIWLGGARARRRRARRDGSNHARLP